MLGKSVLHSLSAPGLEDIGTNKADLNLIYLSDD